MLDNCDHLPDGCAVLAGALLKACPDGLLLVTGRQALGIAGEVRMRAPPMSLPGGGDAVTVERLLNSDAVWLLSERAGAVVPEYTVDASKAAASWACRRMDGIPLAGAKKYVPAYE